MKVAAILLLAALAGVVVYVISLRGVRGDNRATAGSAPPSSSPPMFRPAERWWRLVRLRERWAGLFGGDAKPKPEPDAFAYVPAGPRDGTPLRTRMIGIFGLVLMVAVCAVALAAALWEIGHLVNQGIADYLNR